MDSQTNYSIVITGIAGFIGSSFARWVSKNFPDVNIIGIDNLSGGYKENVPEKARLFVLDLADPKDFQDIDHLFETEKPTYVFHFAAFAPEGLSPFMRSRTFRDNTVATTNVINLCIKHTVQRLVFTSSAAVYGDSKTCREDDIPLPMDPYGISKYASELDIISAGKQHYLDYCIVRPHNVYGPGQNIWDPYRNVFGIWMYKLLHGEIPKIYGDGSQKRSFTYIEDIMYPLWVAAESVGASREIINLGAGSEMTVLEAFRVLCGVTNKPMTCTFESKRKEARDTLPSNNRGAVNLGANSCTSIYEGLGHMWRWAQAQPDKPLQYQEYEIDDKIYPYWKQ